jgi:hypothetical protein
MRIMMKVAIPTETGNKAIKEGILPKTVSAFVEQYKPESCYFFAEHGRRTAMFFFDLKDTASIPSVAESFFMHLNASIEMCPVMNLEDMRTGVERAMRNF